MKRAFQLTEDRHHIVSAIVPRATKDALKLGDRVTLLRTLSLEGGETVPVNSKGTIDDINTDTGALEVLMDKRHTAMDQWDNHLWLEPFDTPEFSEAVYVSGPRRFPRITARACGIVGASAVLGVTIATAHNFFYVSPDMTLTLIDDLDRAAHVFSRTFVLAVITASAFATL